VLRIRRRRDDRRPTVELPLALAVLLLVAAYPVYGLAAAVFPPLRGLRAPGHFFDLVPFSFYALLGVALVAIDRHIDDPFARNGIVLGIGLLVALDFWPSNEAFVRSVPAAPIRELARNLADLDGDGATLRVGMYPWYTRDDWIKPTFAVSGSDI